MALMLLIGAMAFVLIEVRKLSKTTERLITQIERGVSPVLNMISKVSNDIASVTETVRLQAARVDMTTDHISKSLAGLVETFTKTGYLLHDTIVEPLLDAAALLKGLSRGFKFFFLDRKR
jgi:hypothetical protein